MPEFLTREFLGNSVQTWMLAAVLAVVAWVALLTIRRIAGSAASKVADKTGIFWNRVVAKCIPRTHRITLIVLAAFLGSRVLDLGIRTDGVLVRALIIIGLIQLGAWASHAASLVVGETRARNRETNPASLTSIGVIGVVIRALVWLLVVLLILANAGIEIAPLLAGLGVGGLALALAVQTILEDLLASFSIILDKPFVVGDFLIIDEHMGAVAHIGLKTTRIRSLSGEQLVFSNKDLLGSRIRNFGRMQERRVVFPIGVTYQTPREKLVKIPTLIREAVESQPGIRFDRSHFQKFGDFSLDFETVYYVGVPDFNTYMDIQQAINLRLYEEFEAEGIEFAYPTQTLFHENLARGSTVQPPDPS